MMGPADKGHSPFPSSERAVYGFALWLASFLLLGMFLLWAFLPDAWLQVMGLTYLPQKEMIHFFLPLSDTLGKTKESKSRLLPMVSNATYSRTAIYCCLAFCQPGYWAVAIPAYVGVGVVMGVVSYAGLNLIMVPPLSDPRTVTDPHPHLPPSSPSNWGSIPPLYDIPISVVNTKLYSIHTRTSSTAE